MTVKYLPRRYRTHRYTVVRYDLTGVGGTCSSPQHISIPVKQRRGKVRGDIVDPILQGG